MQLPFQFCVLLASTGLVFGLAADTKASKVQTLTDQDFDERTSSGDWFLNVYAPWYDMICAAGTLLLRSLTRGQVAEHTRCAGAGTASSWSLYGGVLRRGCMDG